MSPRTSGLSAIFMGGCAIVAFAVATAAHAQSVSFGGFTIPLRNPAAASSSAAVGNPSYGPTREEMAQRESNPADVKAVENAAGTAMRIVKYGLDNEMADKSDVLTARYLMKDVQACLDGIARLKQSNPGVTLYLNGEDGMGLAAVENRFCKPAMAQLEPVAGKAVADYQARWAGLAAERLKVVEMHGLTSYTIYGHGKRVLTTPAQLQGSDVWYVWDEETGYLMPHWWMAAIRWKGNSYTKTVEKGAGSAPPAGLFR